MGDGRIQMIEADVILIPFAGHGVDAAGDDKAEEALTTAMPTIAAPTIATGR